MFGIIKYWYKNQSTMQKYRGHREKIHVKTHNLYDRTQHNKKQLRLHQKMPPYHKENNLSVTFTHKPSLLFRKPNKEEQALTSKKLSA